MGDTWKKKKRFVHEAEKKEWQLFFFFFLSQLMTDFVGYLGRRFPSHTHTHTHDGIEYREFKWRTRGEIRSLLSSANKRLSLSRASIEGSTVFTLKKKKKQLYLFCYI